MFYLKIDLLGSLPVWIPLGGTTQFAEEIYKRYKKTPNFVGASIQLLAENAEGERCYNTVKVFGGS